VNSTGDNLLKPNENTKGMKLLEVQKDIAIAFALAKDTEEAMWHLVNHISTIEGIDSVKAYLFDKDVNEFYLTSDSSKGKDIIEKDFINSKDAIFESIQRGDRIHIKNSDLKKPLPTYPNLEKGYDIAVIPVKQNENVIAVLYISKYGHEKISDHKKDVMETVTSNLGELIARVQEIEDLQKREIFSKEVISSLPLGMITVKKNGEITSANPFLLNILGSPSEEATRKFNILEHTPLIENGISDLMHKCMESGEIIVSENPYRSAWGKELYMHISIVPIIDENGIVTHCHALVEDITEKKKIKQDLKERDDRLQSIFRAAPTGIGMTRGRVIKEVNEKICKITGYTKEELIGAKAQMLYTSDEDYKYVGTEKYDQMRKYGSGTVETKWQRKDGSVLDILLSSSPIDPNDHTKGITFTALDITGRKRMENALKESNERFRTIVEQATEEIFAYDIEGKIILVNDLASKNTGYTKEELLAMNIADICLLKQCGNSGKIIEYKDDVFETKHRKKDGTAYPVEVRITPISFAGKQIILELSHDISKSKRAKEAMLTAKLAAEAANRTKSEFLANMSHELRTPLNSVIGFSEVLMRQTSGSMNPVQRKYANHIHKNGKNLLAIINNILTLSKIETGEMDIHHTTFATKKIIEEIELMTRGLSKKKYIDVTIKTSSDVYIESDLRKFNTILYNLLNNAIKFTPESGRIIIEEKVVDDRLQVSLTDTGIGIAEEDIKNLFKPFGQLDSSSTRKFGGTGIGLILVKKYLDMLDGTILVESELGQGSRFTFTLPIKTENSHEG